MKTLKKVWDAFVKGYTWVELNFIAAFTMIIGILIIYEVIIRALGFQGIKWMEEMGRFMLVVTTTIGCSYAARENGHMVMDTFYQLLRPRAAYCLKSVAYFISGLLYSYMGYYAIQWCIRLFKMKKKMESVNFPTYVMWIFVCIGLCTMGLRYFIETGKCAGRAVKGAQEFTEVNTKEN
ncbi:hypothetical protein CE91St43_17880 [Oscillospiraceae bacterium]|nr:hypothetical protein CE91St43_17880 [Oscillospiraceae bacterium]